MHGAQPAMWGVWCYGGIGHRGFRILGVRGCALGELRFRVALMFESGPCKLSPGGGEWSDSRYDMRICCLRLGADATRRPQRLF